MRASYVMRRGSYYGGFCPKAQKRYGDEAAKSSFRYPDRDEGTRACSREAIELHAKTAYGHVRQIAAANDEPVAIPLGTYEDADEDWRKKNAS
jgi:hypothetical protein